MKPSYSLWDSIAPMMFPYATVDVNNIYGRLSQLCTQPHLRWINNVGGCIDGPDLPPELATISSNGLTWAQMDNPANDKAVLEESGRLIALCQTGRKYGYTPRATDSASDIKRPPVAGGLLIEAVGTERASCD